MPLRFPTLPTPTTCTSASQVKNFSACKSSWVAMTAPLKAFALVAANSPVLFTYEEILAIGTDTGKLRAAYVKAGVAVPTDLVETVAPEPTTSSYVPHALAVDALRLPPSTSSTVSMSSTVSTSSTSSTSSTTSGTPGTLTGTTVPSVVTPSGAMTVPSVASQIGRRTALPGGEGAFVNYVLKCAELSATVPGVAVSLHGEDWAGGRGEATIYMWCTLLQNGAEVHGKDNSTFVFHYHPDLPENPSNPDLSRYHFKPVDQGSFRFQKSELDRYRRRGAPGLDALVRAALAKAQAVAKTPRPESKR